ncbi:MAG: flagellar motor protein [Armatimonadota bacterium]
MDLATVIGLFLAWGAFLGSVLMEGTHITALVNVPAAILVVGGTVGATIFSYPMEQIVRIPLLVKKALFAERLDMSETANTIISLARKARREGILVLEQEARTLSNRFLSTGIQLVVDGLPAEAVRETLENELLALQERHRAGESIFMSMGGYSPTLGVIGTVAGLVHMLSNLSDPGKMGPAIASAFIATLYGVSLANLLYLPIANKLKVRSQEEVALYTLMIEGILSIQAGDNPRVVESKIVSYLPPKQRALVSSSAQAPQEALVQ